MSDFDPSRLPDDERLHWLSRADWKAGRVSHSAGGIALFLWFFALAWFGFVGFLLYVNAAKLAAALAEGFTGWIVPLLVVLVGVIALIAAVRTTIFWLRYGRTTLRIKSLPALVGGRFEGELEAGANLLGRRPFRLTLQCDNVTSHTRRVGKGFSKRRKHDHFVRTSFGKATALVDQAPRPGASGSVLPVAIDVPPGPPGSLHHADGTGVQWTLTIMSDDGKKPVFSAAFEVPIYRREDLLPG